MDRDSVTQWLRQFREGDHDAARRLWQRYSAALLRLARDRFPGAISPAADEEDLVQSVFQALWTGASGGCLDEVKDRSELWWLLMAITRRKALNRQAYDGRQKRAGHVTSLSLMETNLELSDVTPRGALADDLPPPDVIVMLEEEQQRLLTSLRDEVLRSIAVGKLDGFTNEELAAKLGVTKRTIVRKLNLIRTSWSKELES